MGLGIGGLFGLTAMGWIAPWTGRFYSLWDTNYAKIHIPIIASVSEHQPTAWPAFFFDTSMLIWLFPAGIYLCFQELKDEHVFIIIYSVLCSYFAGVMVRLMLTLTPVICVAAAIALSKLFDVYLDIVDLFTEKLIITTKMMMMTASPSVQLKIKFQIPNCWIIIKTFGVIIIHFLPFLLCFTLYLGNIKCLFITIGCFSIKKPRWLTTYH